MRAPRQPAAREGLVEISTRSVSTLTMGAHGRRGIRAQTMMPVRPMPPSVASNSRVAVGLQLEPPGGGEQTEREHVGAEGAAAAWFLPWTSLAIAPPT